MLELVGIPTGLWEHCIFWLALFLHYLHHGVELKGPVFPALQGLMLMTAAFPAYFKDGNRMLIFLCIANICINLSPKRWISDSNKRGKGIDSVFDTPLTKNISTFLNSRVNKFCPCTRAKILCSAAWEQGLANSGSLNPPMLPGPTEVREHIAIGDILTPPRAEEWQRQRMSCLPLIYYETAV